MNGTSETNAPGETGATPPVPTAGVRATGALRVMEIFQTVLTGLMLAFIFRAFFVEPFIIPSGSMADALLGAHAKRTCPACGWEYSFAPLRSGSSRGGAFLRPDEIICPNCQLRLEPTAADTIPQAGDRILVHKWPYMLGLLKPQRWDVIVFRDPADPEQHYIKRVVGLPDERLEIVDGDVFIDGRVARKPPHVQAALWLVVYDQSRVPDPESAAGAQPRWVSVQPPADDGQGWSGLQSRVVRYEGLDDTPRRIAFNPDTGAEYLQDLYAYDRRSSGAFVHDVRLTTELTVQAGEGWWQWELSWPPRRFRVRVGVSGAVELEVQTPELSPGAGLVRTASVGRFEAGRPVAVEVGHVDYRVYVRIDGREVLATGDEEYGPDQVATGQSGLDRPVGLQLSAQGVRMELRGLRIDRDVYYTRSNYTRRALAGQPFVLRSDEYFVLGDNSPDSHDSREWTSAGAHLPPDYRPGTVPAGQIVGQAALVYLPSLLPLDSGGRWFVPDVGRVRFVR